jgi:DNA-binding transcriptional regulator YdaS (Cro superfamily)
MFLREYLADHGLTQQEFADSVGVSRATVSYWSRGIKQPRPLHATKIRAATRGEVTSEDLQAASEIAR